MAAEQSPDPSLVQLRERMIQAFRIYVGTETSNPARTVAWDAYVTAREHYLRVSALVIGCRYEPLRVTLEH